MESPKTSIRVKRYSQKKLVKLSGKSAKKLSARNLEHAKRGISGPIHQKVKARKLSGTTFSSKTQEHVSRKPIMNDIYFDFLISSIIYTKVTILWLYFKRNKRSNDLKPRPQPWLRPRMSLKTMVSMTKVMAKPRLRPNDFLSLFK